MPQLPPAHIIDLRAAWNIARSVVEVRDAIVNLICQSPWVDDVEPDSAIDITMQYLAQATTFRQMAVELGRLRQLARNSDCDLLLPFNVS